MPRRSLVHLLTFGSLLSVAACGDGAVGLTEPGLAPSSALRANATDAFTTAASPAPFSLPWEASALTGAVTFASPIITPPQRPAAVDVSLLALLTVKVCTPTSSGGCGTVLATFSAESPGATRLRLDPSTAEYLTTWRPLAQQMGTTTRLSVEVSGLEIGSMPYVVGPGAIPIKFWVSNNAAVRVRAMRARGFTATQIADVLVSEFGLDAQMVATRLFSDLAPFTPTEVASALRFSALGASDVQAVTVFRTLGVPVVLAGTALRDAYGLAAGAGATALKGAGYLVNEVGGAMQTVYGLGADAAAAALKGAGFLVNEVAGAMQTVYGLGADAAAAALKGAGFLVNEVAGAMQTVYGLGADAAAAALKGAGFLVNQVAGAMQTVYGLTAGAAATALKAAGFAISEVADALRTVYSLGQQAVANALRTAGWAIGEVQEALQSVWGAIEDGICFFLGC